MDGIDYCEECEKDHREEVKKLIEQLKRKEQENKRLKEDEKSLLNVIDELQKEKNKWVEKYNDLGQDFDQLKKNNEELRKCYKNNSALLDFEETNTTKLVNKVMKLEQTLIEIKDIAEANIRIADLEGLNGVYRRGLAKQILQKISEI